jgi:hypothetical protein
MLSAISLVSHVLSAANGTFTLSVVMLGFVMLNVEAPLEKIEIIICSVKQFGGFVGYDILRWSH